MKSEEISVGDGLVARTLSLGYTEDRVIDGIDVRFPPAQLTAIVGPNACGKSTLLRGLAQLLRPSQGAVYLDGHAIANLSAKEVAQRIGMLPQSAVSPEGITVGELVSRGRFPHQRFFSQWSHHDEQVVLDALEATRTEDLIARKVDQLSGGQRQRVWIAMALAQETSTLLLDEPTTYLDIAHQIDILDLCEDLKVQGRTIVVVLHDLNHACRYADHMVVMSEGQVVATGPPSQLVTTVLIEQVFGIRCRIISDPETLTPLVVPVRRSATSPR